jgi:hypothetical protein
MWAAVTNPAANDVDACVLASTLMRYLISRAGRRCYASLQLLLPLSLPLPLLLLSDVAAQALYAHAHAHQLDTELRAR